MKRETNILNKFLDKKRDEFTDEYNQLIENMYPYDVTAFTIELQSAFSYYSLMFFNEEKFAKAVKQNFNLDVNDPIVKELTIDNIYAYSYAFIALEALREYIRANDIILGGDNE